MSEKLVSVLADDVAELMAQEKPMDEIVQQIGAGTFFKPIDETELLSGQVLEAVEFAKAFEAWATENYGSVGNYYQHKADEHGKVGTI